MIADSIVFDEGQIQQGPARRSEPALDHALNEIETYFNQSITTTSSLIILTDSIVVEPMPIAPLAVALADDVPVSSIA